MLLVIKKKKSPVVALKVDKCSFKYVFRVPSRHYQCHGIQPIRKLEKSQSGRVHGAWGMIKTQLTLGSSGMHFSGEWRVYGSGTRCFNR